jgi:MFS family permease
MLKLYRGWGVVSAVALALTISGTTFAAGSFGILTAYLNRTYGWSQAQMAPALSTFLLCATVCVPIVGVMVDRFGTRLVASLGMTAFAGVLAAGSLISSVVSLYIFYATLGFIGAFTNPVVYLRAISQWFDSRRGLALGLAITGQGLGGAMLPIFIVRVSELAGWRGALLSLAAVLLLVLLPAVAFLVKDRPSAGETAEVAAQPDAGLHLNQAFRERSFWLILVVLGLLGLATYAMSANLANLLIHVHKWSFRQTASLGAVSGLSMVIGRVVFGWFMDRFHAPYVGAVGVLMLTAAAATFPLLQGFGPFALLWGMMVGLSTGAETDLLTLLVSRYFGNLALSRIYSWHNVTFLIGAAAGPPLFAFAVAGFGGPAPALASVAALSALAAGLLLCLGPYPSFAPARAGVAAEVAEGVI